MTSRAVKFFFSFPQSLYLRKFRVKLRFVDRNCRQTIQRRFKMYIDSFLFSKSIHDKSAIFERVRNDKDSDYIVKKRIMFAFV